jgi:DNA processing protein
VVAFIPGRISVDDDKKYWVGFNLVKGIGSARMRMLLENFESPKIAWQSEKKALLSAGLGERIVENLELIRGTDSLEQTWEKILQEKIQVLTWEDESYPRRLKEIEQPPPVLYLRGSLIEDDRWAVAVVGTRRITAYGRQITEEIGRNLAHHGVTVVSGLARGVDSVAHLAALNNGGRTLAVMGSGVDQIYPPEHRNLAEQIIDQGALISDYPPGTAPEAANFPPRNRIISGLAQAVVIVEAGEKSGALITAAFAAEQGRQVFAVPGYLYAPQSRGTNQLIQQGAQIFLGSDDLLRSLNMTQKDLQQTARKVLPADAVEAQLYAMLGREPVHVDDLQIQANLPIEQVSATLTMMELKGLVRQVGTMRYIAVFEPHETYSVDGENK